MKFNPEKISDVLEEISDRLENDVSTDEYIRRLVMKFIIELTRLAEKVKDSDTGTAHNGSYTRLFAAFAEMCCLQPVHTVCEIDQSIMEDLLTPDIRLYKYGLTIKSSIRTEKTAVSVVQILKKGHVITELSDEDDLFSDDDGSSLEDEERPSLEQDLDEKILGKHAGELLLTIRDFLSDEETTNLAMHGMIVDGTKVIFTLLEISSQHFYKLEQNEELNPSDRATIYYSKPYNMLNYYNRGVLIDNFIRLNNIEYKTGA